MSWRDKEETRIKELNGGEGHGKRRVKANWERQLTLMAQVKPGGYMWQNC